MGARIKETYEVYHEHMAAGHLGVAEIHARIQRRYYWPSMVERRWCVLMKEAQRKSSGQSKEKLKPIPGATRVWEIISMDIVGSVWQSGNGDRYTLKLSDCSSYFMMMISIINQTAKYVVTHLGKFSFKWKSGDQITLNNRFFLFLRKTNSQIIWNEIAKSNQFFSKNFF